MFVLKLFGMAMLFSASSLFGLFKANECNKRVKTLGETVAGLSKLRDRVMYGGGERTMLFKACFPKGDLLSDRSLNEDDRKLLKEFFSAFGSSGTESECERITLYEQIFTKRRAEAENYAARTCRLWKTAGFCAGLAGCIFLF